MVLVVLWTWKRAKGNAGVGGVVGWLFDFSFFYWFVGVAGVGVCVRGQEKARKKLVGAGAAGVRQGEGPFVE
jgi:hypothetical protein